MSLALYAVIFGGVLWALSRVAEPGEAVLSRICIALFLSPFLAFFLANGLQAVGLNRLGGELLVVLFFVTALSWFAAAALAVGAALFGRVSGD